MRTSVGFMYVKGNGPMKTKAKRNRQFPKLKLIRFNNLNGIRLAYQKLRIKLEIQYYQSKFQKQHFQSCNKVQKSGMRRQQQQSRLQHLSGKNIILSIR